LVEVVPRPMVVCAAADVVAALLAGVVEDATAVESPDAKGAEEVSAVREGPVTSEVLRDIPPNILIHRMINARGITAAAANNITFADLKGLRFFLLSCFSGEFFIGSKPLSG